MPRAPSRGRQGVTAPTAASIARSESRVRGSIPPQVANGAGAKRKMPLADTVNTGALDLSRTAKLLKQETVAATAGTSESANSAAVSTGHEPTAAVPAAAPVNSRIPIPSSSTTGRRITLNLNGVPISCEIKRDIDGRARRTVTDELLKPMYKNDTGMKKLLVSKETKLLLFEQYLTEGILPDLVASSLAGEKATLEGSRIELLRRDAELSARAAEVAAREVEVRRLQQVHAGISSQHKADLESMCAAQAAVVDAIKAAHEREMTATNAAAEHALSMAVAAARREAEAAIEAAADAAEDAAGSRAAAVAAELAADAESKLAAARREGAEAVQAAIAKAERDMARAAAAAAADKHAAVEAAIEGVRREASAQAATDAANAASRLASEVAAAQARGADMLAAAVAAHAVEMSALRQSLANAQSATEASSAELERARAAAATTRTELNARLDAALAGVASRDAELETRGTALAEALAREVALMARLEASDARRLALQETVLTLKGAIRVFVRVRPLIPGETETVAAPPLFRFPDASDEATALEVVEKPGAGIGGYGVGEAKRHGFAFQRAFPPTAGQAELFAEVEGLVHSVLDGHRVCAFAYGQTGSGKTWTMLGGSGDDERGLIPRSVDYVFSTAGAMAVKGWALKANVEMLEIYNEEVRDLLGANPNTTHDVRHDKEGNTVVTNLSTHGVASAADVATLLERAARARATGATASNAVSSRSHSVFILRIELTHAATAQTRRGILNLIDLAGSERLAKSGANDAKAGGNAQLLSETQSINSSLSSLSKVIRAMQDRASHVPFRDSKLTYLLQHSLSGKGCKTLLVANVNPLHANTHESLCTLRFAESVAAVRGGTAAAGSTAK